MAVDVRDTAGAPSTPIWLDARYRAIFFQVALLALVGVWEATEWALSDDRSQL